MQRQILLVMAGLLAIGTLTVLLSPPGMTEDSANFSEADKVKLRKLVQNAGQLFDNDYPVMASYLRGQLKANWGSFWNVLIFVKKEYFNTSVTLTGMYDATHTNKRYFRVLDTKPFDWCVLMYETNNTRFNLPPREAQGTAAVSVEGGLAESRNASEYVDAAQLAAIDLALRAAYVANHNLVDFTKAFKDLIGVNLSQNWEVCTALEGLSGEAFVYTSPMQ